jgi:hypothetical protein
MGKGLVPARVQALLEMAKRAARPGPARAQ